MPAGLPSMYSMARQPPQDWPRQVDCDSRPRPCADGVDLGDEAIDAPERGVVGDI